jgi:hypothetical protein
MCLWQQVDHVCGHDAKGDLLELCHFARNDPNHQHFGAWNYKKSAGVLKSDKICPECIKEQVRSAARIAAEQEEAEERKKLEDDQKKSEEDSAMDIDAQK